MALIAFSRWDPIAWVVVTPVLQGPAVKAKRQGMMRDIEGSPRRIAIRLDNRLFDAVERLALHRMPGNPREMIATAERLFPVCIRIVASSAGSRPAAYSIYSNWLDARRSLSRPPTGSRCGCRVGPRPHMLCRKLKTEGGR
jgi:3-methyladenine DNA glycosylase/8-oxoguanine DNA glycosylase